MGNFFSYSDEREFRTMRQEKNYGYYFTRDRFFQLPEGAQDDFLIIDNYINE